VEETEGEGGLLSERGTKGEVEEGVGAEVKDVSVEGGEGKGKSSGEGMGKTEGTLAGMNSVMAIGRGVSD